MQWLFVTFWLEGQTESWKKLQADTTRQNNAIMRFKLFFFHSKQQWMLFEIFSVPKQRNPNVNHRKLHTNWLFAMYHFLISPPPTWYKHLCRYLSMDSAFVLSWNFVFKYIKRSALFKPNVTLNCFYLPKLGMNCLAKSGATSFEHQTDYLKPY